MSRALSVDENQTHLVFTPRYPTPPTVLPLDPLRGCFNFSAIPAIADAVSARVGNQDRTRNSLDATSDHDHRNQRTRLLITGFEIERNYSKELFSKSSNSPILRKLSQPCGGAISMTDFLRRNRLHRAIEMLQDDVLEIVNDTNGAIFVNRFPRLSREMILVQYSSFKVFYTFESSNSPVL